MMARSDPACSIGIPPRQYARSLLGGRRFRLKAELRQQLHKQVVVRVGMTFVLCERFAVGDADFFAAPSAPFFAAFEIFIDAVLLEEPVPLAGMAGQHLEFECECRG